MSSPMNMNMSKEIAKSIVLAQIASDSGKGIYELECDGFESASEDSRLYGYSVKEFHIVRAIEKINCTKRGEFNYYVINLPDQNGCDSIVTYFDFKIDGKRCQVSFHTPLNKASEKLKSFINKGRKTRWYKNVSSRESCIKLIETYEL